MGKDSPPPPPDYGPIAEMSQEQFEMAHDLAERQFQWARQQYRHNRNLTDEVAGIMLPQMRAQARNARADRRFYMRTYRPLERALAKDARTYSSPARKRLEMGKAQAQVAQQFEQARQASQRQLESYGINPGATRFAALDVGVRTAQAAAQAAAGTEASQRVEDIGRALRSEAINVGRGYPGSIAQAYAGSSAAGSGAVGNANQTFATGSGATGTPAQFMGVGNQALGIYGDTLNQGYENQLAYWQAKQGQASGVGSAAGMIAGMALPYILPFEEGGRVPEEASPSRGVATDDAIIAATPGEFVVPEDVVRWKGEEFFQKQIDQSREKRQAIPTERRAPERVPVRGVIPAYAAGGVVRRRIPNTRLSDRRRVTMRMEGGTGDRDPDIIAGPADPTRPPSARPPSRPSEAGGFVQPNTNFVQSNIGSGSPDLYSDYWDDYYNSPAETLNPASFYPRPRPGSDVITIGAKPLPYDDPRWDFNYPPPPTSRPPVRPAVPPPVAALPLRRRRAAPLSYMPVAPAPTYAEIIKGAVPASSSYGRSGVYGGSGFGGAGGAWTGAANDANSFSGGAPGIGNYTGPNPSPTDPDYGYT